MDPIKNPFSPGAGAPPPELVGRDPLLEQARILLGRVKQKRPEKSLLLTGLRGVGKTVLLNEIERMAKAAGYQSILLEAHEEKPLGELIFPALRSLLYELDRAAGAGDTLTVGAPPSAVCAVRTPDAAVIAVSDAKDARDARWPADRPRVIHLASNETPDTSSDTP